MVKVAIYPPNSLILADLIERKGHTPLALQKQIRQKIKDPEIDSPPMNITEEAPFGFGCVGCARTNELSIFCLRKKDIPVLEVVYPDDEDGTRLMVNQIMEFLDSLPGGGGDLEGDSNVLGEPIGTKTETKEGGE